MPRVSELKIMLFDDEEPLKKGKPALKNLEPMSVDALKEYIDALMAEKARVEEEIKRKQATRNAAEALFGKK